jgi:hypothetical protein
VTTHVPDTERLLISRALLEVADQLAEEFPQIAAATIYVSVGNARVLAAGQLPDHAAYRATLHREACRALAQSAAHDHWEIVPEPRE